MFAGGRRGQSAACASTATIGAFKVADIGTAAHSVVGYLAGQGAIAPVRHQVACNTGPEADVAWQHLAYGQRLLSRDPAPG